jgi:peptide/nickel transport system substrate-binding protein
MPRQDTYWSNVQRQYMSRRRALSTIGAGTGAALLVACGGKKQATSGGAGTQGASGNQQPVLGGTLSTWINSNPTGLDTHRNADIHTAQAIGGVQSRLFQYKTGVDPSVALSHDVEGDIATTGESPDGVTWTIKLRPDAKFFNIAPVNGHAVEAEDIKATFVRALTIPGNANRSMMGMIDEAQIETPAKDTVVFKLRYPYAGFTHTLAGAAYSWIFPREALAGAYDPNKVVIGSGPFTLESFTPDVGLTYKKNPDWHFKGRPYIDAAKYALVTDVSQQLAQFKGGNLDVTSVANSNLDAAKRDNPNARLTQGPAVQPNILFGQLGDPASKWSDIRVRQAFSMALDRDALGKVIAPNGGPKQLLVGQSFGKWALKPENLPPDVAKYYQFNIAESKKLLAAAGLADFTFKYIDSGMQGDWQKVAETIHGMLSQAGIKTNYVTLDYNREYIGGGKGIRYGTAPNDAVVYGITTAYDDPDQVLFGYFDSQSTTRNTSITDPKLDAMVTKYRAILNEDERVKAVMDMQLYLARQLYIVDGMPSSSGYIMYQPRVANFQPGASFATYTEVYSKLWLTS